MNVFKVGKYWVNLVVPGTFLIKGQTTQDGLAYKFSELVSVNQKLSLTNFHNYFNVSTVFDFI